MHQRIRRTALWMLCIFARAAVRCRGLSMGTDDRLTGETYPDSENTKRARLPMRRIKSKPLRCIGAPASGNCGIGQSKAQRERSGVLPEETALHYLLEDGVLKIRFCASGAKVRVEGEKRLQLEVSKGIAFSVHTTSARVKARRCGSMIF
ncbi:MAG: hypothetical protein ACLT0Y_03355 [Christensenellales bacterium]